MARTSSIIKVTRYKRPLAAGVTVNKGNLAACVGGFFREATGDPTEIVVGRFYETKTNPGGNGATSADIHHFKERFVFLCENDETNPVLATDREKICSVADAGSVRAATPAASDAGIVFDVTSEGVFVEVGAGGSSPDAAGVPNFQSGTNTLAAGTRTITGVTLTATSRIFITMKDPGAGAITGFAGFDVPAASRNTGTGQFVVNAIDDSKATLSTAVSTFDWLIVG